MPRAASRRSRTLRPTARGSIRRRARRHTIIAVVMIERRQGRLTQRLRIQNGFFDEEPSRQFLHDGVCLAYLQICRLCRLAVSHDTDTNCRVAALPSTLGADGPLSQPFVSKLDLAVAAPWAVAHHEMAVQVSRISKPAELREKIDAAINTLEWQEEDKHRLQTYSGKENWLLTGMDCKGDFVTLMFEWYDERADTCHILYRNFTVVLGLVREHDSERQVLAENKPKLSILS